MRLSRTRLVQAPRAFVNLSGDGVSLDGEFDWEKFRGVILCESPNDKVNDFTGQLKM